jgi:hypothetical protein
MKAESESELHLQNTPKLEAEVQGIYKGGARHRREHKKLPTTPNHKHAFIKNQFQLEKVFNNTPN